MQEGTRACIVVPTVRQDAIASFLDRWEGELSGHRVIVVEDNPWPTFELPGWVEHHAWDAIDRHLGPDAWIIPRRTDCIRSFGLLLSAAERCDLVITLDDDCYPEDAYPGGFIAGVHAALQATWPNDRWLSPLADGVATRGFPYALRTERLATAVHHGLWSNIPDLDALTQQQMPDYRLPPASAVQRVPHRVYFPMCGMNLAFRPMMLGAMYFLLMGQDSAGNPWPYDRFGDIWNGLFVKRIADHLGLAVSSGAPSVRHERASSLEANLLKETPGYPVNEVLWDRVDAVTLAATSPAACYGELADKLAMDGEYWTTLRRAMNIWVRLVCGAAA